MKIEEAIVYCLASSNRGMRTEQIADMINRQRLHLRKDGQPVTSKQVYAVIEILYRADDCGVQIVKLVIPVLIP